MYKLNKLIPFLLCLFFATAAPSFATENSENCPRDYIMDQIGDSEYVVTIADPIEGYNKFMLHFNRGLDRLIIRPITTGYRIVPEPIRFRIYNVFQNLNEPVNLANDILQLKPKQAMKTIWRFVINSTIGVVGLFDAASKFGLEKNNNGFDNTLRHYGVGRGIYVMLPIIGPSSSRATVGLIVDILSAPITYIKSAPAVDALYVSKVIVQRDHLYSEINTLLYETAEPYHAIKSVYEQKHNN